MQQKKVEAPKQTANYQVGRFQFKINNKLQVFQSLRCPKRIIEDAIPSIVGNEELSNPNWKIRLASFESLCSQIIAKEIDSEAVVLYFGSIHPKWKELNIQILAKMTETLSNCASKEFSPAAFVLCAGFLVEKISEPKIKRSNL